MTRLNEGKWLVCMDRKTRGPVKQGSRLSGKRGVGVAGSFRFQPICLVNWPV